MMDHDSERKSEKELWNLYEQKVVTFITTHFGQRWSKQEVFRAIGLIRTNAYSVEAGDQKTFGMARLIFPLVSVM